MSPEGDSRRKQRAKSEDRLLAEFGGENDEFGLLSQSALNDRYFEEKNAANKSKSLDNLLQNDVSENLSFENRTQ